MAQDLLQELQDIRAKYVLTLEREHQKLLSDSLKQLETRVIQSVSELPIRDGALFNTRLAIEIRPKLQQAIEELYLAKVQTFIKDYDKVAGTIVATYGKLPIPIEFKKITEADLVTIQQLKKIAFSQFQNLATEFTNTLAQEVYQSTLVGKPFSEVVDTIRSKINGIYQQADDRKRQELVNFAQDQIAKGKTNTEDFKTAVDELKQTYGSTVTGNNLYSYSSQIVGDALMGFDGQFAKFRADELGLTSFIYYGSIIRDSRDFCVEHANKVFTEEEARALWQSDWQGKSGSDPFLDRGGYNCRHHWQPTSTDWGTVNEDGTFKYTLE
jgi:ferritin